MGPAIPHSVLLVCYGTDNINGKDVNYWLVKKSRSSDWGENGYVKLKKSNGST